MADRHNLLPGFFIEGDPLYTSMFIANPQPGYEPRLHPLRVRRLPLFCMVGKINPVRMEDGKVVEVTLHLRYSYDERSTTGSPAATESVPWPACSPTRPAGWAASVNGSDTRPLWPREDWASDGFQVWD